MKLTNKKVANTVKVISSYDIDDNKIISKDPIFSFKYYDGYKFPDNRKTLSRKYTLTLKYKQWGISYGYTKIRFGNNFEWKRLNGRDDVANLYKIIKNYISSELLTEIIDTRDLFYCKEKEQFSTMELYPIIIEVWLRMSIENKMKFLKDNNITEKKED